MVVERRKKGDKKSRHARNERKDMERWYSNVKLACRTS